jgi:hypothetical protein
MSEKEKRIRENAKGRFAETKLIGNDGSVARPLIRI